MAQEFAIEIAGDLTKLDAVDIEKPQETKRDKTKPLSKIVIRRLPPSMNEETFMEQVSPLPEYDYLYFVRADLSLGPAAFSRAYINFLNQEDILTFKDQYDGYIFVDKTGNEFPAVVEFAPFQRLPKKRGIRRKDVKVGTIEEDPIYLTFLETLAEEIKDKENEHTFDYSYKPPDNEDKKITTTPLLEFLKLRRAERQRSRDERRDDRRKKEREREIERRKSRDDEKRRKRTDSKEKESGTSNTTIAAKQVLRHSSAVNEKEAAANKTVKDKDIKQGERKREEENASYKDRKYPDKVRDKPGFKANQSGRQKSFDSRTQRDDRRSVEDLGKKPPARLPESQDKRKPPSRFQDKDVATREAPRNKEREVRRKTGRDEVKRSVDNKKPVASEEAAENIYERETKKRELKKVEAAAEATPDVDKARRSSLETEPGNVKAASRSLENLGPAEDDKTKKKSDTETRRSSLGSGSEVAAGEKGMIRRNHSLEEARSREDTETRRSSLGGGSEVADGERGMIRRNHSLEEDRSREESVESSVDGEDKKREQRPERRIRNKDRPSIEIYRPGMGRFSKQRIDRDKE